MRPGEVSLSKYTFGSPIEDEKVKIGCTRGWECLSENWLACPSS